MLYKSDQGFSLLGMLLIVVIIAGIGGTGWYVWQAKQEADRNIEATTQTSDGTSQSDSDTAHSTESVDSWLLYTSPSKSYSMRLANGWKLERYQKSDSLYAFGNSNLVPKSGVQATVTEVQGGKDGTGIGINIHYASVLPSDNPLGTVVDEGVNADGVKIKHYKYVETSGENEGLGGLPKGAVQHTFVATKDGRSVVVAYGIESTDQDYSETVSKAVNSLKFL